MNRRQFTALLAGSMACIPGSAQAFGDASKVGVAELDLGPGTLSRPNAWKRLLYDVRHTTSVETNATVALLEPDDPQLFEYPFCVLLGDGAFALPTDGKLEQLKRFMDYGGLLFIDDTVGAERSPFDASVRKLVAALFPNRPLAPLPEDHSLFRSFFLKPKPQGRIAQYPYVEGISVGNLAPLVYFRNDLSGALDRDRTGRERPCVPGGERQRREARKLAMNVVLYCITSNYKKDQAHVAELIRQNRLPGGFSE